LSKQQKKKQYKEWGSNPIKKNGGWNHKKNQFYKSSQIKKITIKRLGTKSKRWKNWRVKLQINSNLK